MEKIGIMTEVLTEGVLKMHWNGVVLYSTTGNSKNVNYQELYYITRNICIFYVYKYNFLDFSVFYQPPTHKKKVKIKKLENLPTMNY